MCAHDKLRPSKTRLTINLPVAMREMVDLRASQKGVKITKWVRDVIRKELCE